MKRNGGAKSPGTAFATARMAALMAGLCAGLLLFAGCKDLFHPEGSDDGGYYDPTYTVTFYYDGGAVDYFFWGERNVSSGNSIGSYDMPGEPSWRDAYAFDGWWTGKNGGGTLFTSLTPVYRDMPVYAKWTALTAPAVYTLTQNPNYDNYIVETIDFLPDGFAVRAGDRIEISFFIKTGADITNFNVGIADWANGGDWVATDWDDSKSLDADGRFHRCSWTLTSQSSAPAGSAPLMVQLAINSVRETQVAIYISNVSVTGGSGVSW